jgi:uncharacterized small protein (TIGR04563 family)
VRCHPVTGRASNLDLAYLDAEVTMATGDKRKQSLYFPEDMLTEIQHEAGRLDRSLSWIVQQSWKLARGPNKEIPSSNDEPSSLPDPREEP